MDKKKISSIAAELGRTGGKSTFKKHGKAHYKKMNELSVAKRRKARQEREKAL